MRASSHQPCDTASVAFTRAEVAKRIGRSVSTVRKMEGLGILRPHVALDGRRSFNGAEVERAAERLARTGRALDPRSADEPPGVAGDLREQLDAALQRIVELEDRAQMASLDHDRFRARLIQALDDVIVLVPPRSSAMIAALERVIELLS